MQGTLDFALLKVLPFSQPYDISGYGDNSISNDMITEVYLTQFCQKTRQLESAQYLRTLTG